MNERIKELKDQCWVEKCIPHWDNGMWIEKHIDLEKFAELIVKECTAVLFDQSEKLFELYSEETNMSTAQEYELCSNQCVNNIELIEKHFGVEE